MRRYLLAFDGFHCSFSFFLKEKTYVGRLLPPPLIPLLRCLDGGSRVMRPLRLGCALVLFSCWASVGLSQNLISLIPQSDVPLKPDYSAVFRSQAEVQAGKKFSGFAWLSVVDSLITPSDWEVVLENVISNGGHRNEATYSDWTGVANNAIPAQSDPILYEARVEAPAQPPIGSVGFATEEVLEHLVNPNSFANGPWISLVSAEAYPWSHTVAALQHKVVRILVLYKLVQYKPDAANGGRLRVALDLYSFTKKRWVEKRAWVCPNYYQMSVMDIFGTVLDYDDDDDKEFISDSKPEGEPGDLYVKWQVRLTNGIGAIEYDYQEGIVYVWSRQLP